MAETTRARGADLGVAFDGDADRAIFATREGRLADGDHVLYALAPFLARQGNLKGGAVVGTLMTNLALELALARQGIGLKRTAVGDKYVLEEMLRSGISLGGEQSGHIIFSDLSLAGDGMITLLEVLRLLAETAAAFRRIAARLPTVPAIDSQRARAGKAAAGIDTQRRARPSPNAARSWANAAAWWCATPAPNPWRASWWKARSTGRGRPHGAHRRGH